MILGKKPVKFKQNSGDQIQIFIALTCMEYHEHTQGGQITKFGQHIP